MENNFHNGLELVLEHIKKSKALGRVNGAVRLSTLVKLGQSIPAISELTPPRPAKANPAREPEARPPVTHSADPATRVIHSQISLEKIEVRRETSPTKLLQAEHPTTISLKDRPVVGAPVILDTRAKIQQLLALRERVMPCVLCRHLADNRSQVVFGVGDPDAKLMFVGEAPGADEDRLGEPFVGKAGQLLTKIIMAMGLGRESVYLANVLKCWPDMPEASSGNRPPTDEEMSTCRPYLKEQIRIVQPKVLVALGATAVKGLTGRGLPITRIRGKWMEFEGFPLMPTFHPSYLLHRQSVEEKRKVWEDLLLVMERLGLAISEKQRTFFTRQSGQSS